MLKTESGEEWGPNLYVPYSLFYHRLLEVRYIDFNFSFTPTYVLHRSRQVSNSRVVKRKTSDWTALGPSLGFLLNFNVGKIRSSFLDVLLRVFLVVFLDVSLYLGIIRHHLGSILLLTMLYITNSEVGFCKVRVGLNYCRAI
ncbi:hypothetical protein VN97_g10318 [Penicillium thymicola]|uniref:Uncharacterized protein n=1 Tax=Penicillium thymicola TaxID=293382 RepID=A0AAI9TAQ1_PENTH|nr:hypothetical protein VN97_g10318 [Penicillium thymicola]